MRYSQTVLDHFYHPRNVGSFVVDQYVGNAVVGTKGNGDVIQFQIQVMGGIIHEARFKAHGSCPTIAACSMLTEWVRGKTLVFADEITAPQLLQALDLPDIKLHCTFLAVDALKKTIQDYLMKC